MLGGAVRRMCSRTTIRASVSGSSGAATAARALNAAAVRLMGSDLLTVRIDLDLEWSAQRGHAGG
jgi:hypothetical protein